MTVTFTYRPKDRFSKESDRWLKRLRKIIKRVEAPEGHYLICGRTHGLNAPYVEVLQVTDDGVLRVGKSYIAGMATKTWVHAEIKELLR